MSPFRWVAVSVLVVAVIGVGALAPTILGGANASESTGTVATSCSTSAAVSSATAISATATSATATSGATSTTSQSSTASTEPPGTQALSFTFTPASPIRVDAVEYAKSVGVNGSTYVTFYVAYTNIGSSDVYTVVGCGSSLTASFQSGNGVIEKVTTGPVCLCDEAMTPLASGQNRTATTPGCWSGFSFVLVDHGTVQVDFALYWGSSQASPYQTFTNITAQFEF